MRVAFTERRCALAIPFRWDDGSSPAPHRAGAVPADIRWFPSAGLKDHLFHPHQSTIAGTSGFSTLTVQSDTTIENCQDSWW